MRRRGQLIFDQLVAGLHRTVAAIVDEHGSGCDVVREVQAAFEVVASELVDAPLGDWFRGIGPQFRDDVDRAITEIAAENIFDEHPAPRSRTTH